MKNPYEDNEAMEMGTVGSGSIRNIKLNVNIPNSSRPNEKVNIEEENQ